MASRGKTIIVSSDCHGKMSEGYIAAGETPKPGTVLQRDATVALKGGRGTFKIYDRDADGNRPLGALWVLIEDRLRGDRTETTAYVAGDHCFLYCPQAGDELNMLIADVAGTATISAGILLIVDDGTGKLIATTGSPESEPFLLLADLVGQAADVLGWCEYTGY